MEENKDNEQVQDIEYGQIIQMWVLIQVAVAENVWMGQDLMYIDVSFISYVLEVQLTCKIKIVCYGDDYNC